MTIMLSKNDNGKTIDVTCGEHFEITLPSNPSTGYKWVPKDVPPEGKDAHFDVSYQFHAGHAPPGMVGVGGQDVFRVIPRTQSERQFVLQYKRPWMEEVEETFTITVKSK